MPMEVVAKAPCELFIHRGNLLASRRKSIQHAVLRPPARLKEIPGIAPGSREHKQLGRVLPVGALFARKVNPRGIRDRTGMSIAHVPAKLAEYPSASSIYYSICQTYTWFTDVNCPTHLAVMDIYVTASTLSAYARHILVSHLHAGVIGGELGG
jgi:hypothetical protein